MVTEAALAEAFRQGQAQGAARAQAAVRVAFDRYSGREPARYLDSAVRVLALGHAQSAAAGRAYYVESRVAAGLPVDLPATEPVLFDLEAAVVSLRVNGEVAEARKVREGLGDQAAREFARAETLRYTKRVVLGGARDTVTRLALADRDALGFSRISDGRPCAFCAMLVSRGPVYTADTAGFRAHNGCGCMPRPRGPRRPARGVPRHRPGGRPGRARRVPARGAAGRRGPGRRRCRAGRTWRRWGRGGAAGGAPRAACRRCRCGDSAARAAASPRPGSRRPGPARGNSRARRRGPRPRGWSP